MSPCCPTLLLLALTQFKMPQHVLYFPSQPWDQGLAPGEGAFRDQSLIRLQLLGCLSILVAEIITLFTEGKILRQQTWASTNWLGSWQCWWWISESAVLAPMGPWALGREGQKKGRCVFLVWWFNLPSDGNNQNLLVCLVQHENVNPGLKSVSECSVHKSEDWGSIPQHPQSSIHVKVCLLPWCPRDVIPRARRWAVDSVRGPCLIKHSEQWGRLI